MQKYINTAIAIDSTLFILLIIVLVVAVIIDMKIYKIPNLLTYPAILISIIMHTIFNGSSGFIFSILGLIVGTGVFLLPFLCGVMGAGDAKLMGAVGAVLGIRGVLNACLFTTIAGGIFALITLVIHYKGISFIARYKDMLMTSMLAKRFLAMPDLEAKQSPQLCYGVAIAAGTFYTMYWKLAYYSFPL